MTRMNIHCFYFMSDRSNKIMEITEILIQVIEHMSNMSDRLFFNNMMSNSKFLNKRYFDLTLKITTNFNLKCPRTLIYSDFDLR